MIAFGLAVALQIAATAQTLTFDAGVRNPSIARDGRVVLESRGDIWLAPSLGAGAVASTWTRITAGAGWDRAPVWSRDGQWIYFASDRDGSYDIWRLAMPALLAAVPERLTSGTAVDGNPSVAPDGSVVFERGRGLAADIWLRASDGTEKRLTSENGAERWPVFSPDGNVIAYVTIRGAARTLRLVNRDGSNDRVLLADYGAEYPSWSPDGTRIAFSATGTRAGVWVTDLEARYIVPVTLQRAATSWTADGARIVLTEMPAEAGGGYNGDPDRVGDRDVGDFFPVVGRMWTADAPKLLSATLAAVNVSLPLDRRAFNAERFDRAADLTARLYLSTPNAATRLASWKTTVAKGRDRALSAQSDAELDQIIHDVLRDRPHLRELATGQGAVSSAHPDATNAGLEILRKGGNVVDAAVAVSFALGVVEPDASGIGGYGQMLVYLSGMPKPVNIEFMTTVPEIASIRNTAFPPGGRFPADGPMLANVPGTVAAMHLAWTKYGSKKVPWADLVAPAIHLAEYGFVISDGLGTTLSLERESYLKYEAPTKLFFRDGQPLKAGDTLRNPDLAATLKAIAAGGADAFYRGEIARRMVEDLTAQGNAIRLPDLDKYRAVEREVVSGTFRGNEVYSAPPPVSGGAGLIAQLNTLEQFKTPKAYTDDAPSLHATVAAWILAPRASAVDPDLWTNDFAPAISKDSARARWSCFSLTRGLSPDMLQGTREACRTGASAVIPAKAGTQGGGEQTYSWLPGASIASSARGEWSPECERTDPATAGMPCRSTGTTAFAVADAYGNMVSTTQTLGTWGGNFYITPGLGFIYNDKVGSYSGGNAEARGARVAGARHGSTIAPTIVFKGSGSSRRPWIAVGAAGNAWITSAVYQTIVGIVDGGLDPQKALELPRFSTAASGGGRGGAGRGGAAAAGAGAAATPARGGYTITMENGVSPRVVQQMEALGYRFSWITHRGEIRQGYGAAVVAEPGKVTAGGDPRRSGVGGAVTCREMGRKSC